MQELNTSQLLTRRASSVLANSQLPTPLLSDQQENEKTVKRHTKNMEERVTFPDDAVKRPPPEPTELSSKNASTVVQNKSVTDHVKEDTPLPMHDSVSKQLELVALLQDVLRTEEVKLQTLESLVQSRLDTKPASTTRPVPPSKDQPKVYQPMAAPRPVATSTPGGRPQNRVGVITVTSMRNTRDQRTPGADTRDQRMSVDMANPVGKTSLGKPGSASSGVGVPGDSMKGHPSSYGGSSNSCSHSSDSPNMSGYGFSGGRGSQQSSQSTPVFRSVGSSHGRSGPSQPLSSHVVEKVDTTKELARRLEPACDLPTVSVPAHSWVAIPNVNSVDYSIVRGLSACVDYLDASTTSTGLGQLKRAAVCSRCRCTSGPGVTDAAAATNSDGAVAVLCDSCQTSDCKKRCKAAYSDAIRETLGKTSAVHPPASVDQNGPPQRPTVVLQAPSAPGSNHPGSHIISTGAHVVLTTTTVVSPSPVITVVTKPKVVIANQLVSSSGGVQPSLVNQLQQRHLRQEEAMYSRGELIWHNYVPPQRRLGDTAATATATTGPSVDDYQSQLSISEKWSLRK